MTGWQQGMPSLMGMSDTRTLIPSAPSLMNYQPGQMSQLAFQMAGSPHQGPSPAVAAPMGTNPTNAGGGFANSALGGTALGLLGLLAKNPSLLNSAGGALKSLFGGSPNTSGIDQLFGVGSTGAPQLNLTGSNPIDLSSLTNSQYFGGYPSSGYDAAGAPQPIDVTNTNLDNLGTTDLFGTSYGGGFSGAGGQAAASTQMNAQPTTNYGGLMSGAGNALGLAGGLAQGGVGGYGSAALNAEQLASKAGLLGDTASKFNGAAGLGANALGIYSGLKQGGVSGDTSAAVNAAQLAGRTGALGGASGAISSAAGYAAIPLALYNEINNWQSGNTGMDAAGGAATGAAVGSVVPGIGTAIGALIGVAAGALSSAFGPGKIDPETRGVQNLLDVVGSHPGQASAITAQVQNPYLQMAGLFDRRDSTLPMYSQFGRMGESKFSTALINQINTAYNQGAINKNTSPTDVYNKVVSPWVNSMGSGYSNVGKTYTDTTQGLVQQMVNQYMNGSYKNAWKSVGGSAIAAAAPEYGSGKMASTDGTWIKGG